MRRLNKSNPFIHHHLQKENEKSKLYSFVRIITKWARCNDYNSLFWKTKINENLKENGHNKSSKSKIIKRNKEDL